MKAVRHKFKKVGNGVGYCEKCGLIRRTLYWSNYGGKYITERLYVSLFLDVSKKAGTCAK